MRIKFDLSQNKALRLAKFFGDEFGIPREQYLRRDTTASNIAFEQYFEGVKLANAPTVWSTDSAAFLSEILRIRGGSVHNTMALLGLDKGDDTVKVSVTLVRLDDDGIPRATSIGIGGYKTTGVKNLLLLAATVASEDYDTVECLMNALPLPPGMRYKVVVDHKMKSSVCGLSGGNPTHPCEICTYDRNKNDNYDEQKDGVVRRTFQQLRADNAAWRAAGSVSKNQRQYNNVIRPPMQFLPHEGEVWDTITLSGLHLTINITSRIANHGMTNGTRAATKLMKQWLEDDLALKKFAQRDEWEGGKCVFIISPRSIAKLQARIDSDTRATSDRLAASRTRDIHPAMKYLNALVAFRNVRTAAFGASVSDDAELRVAEFRAAYLKLGLSVSRTVHVVLRHLVPFCRRNRCGLGPFVEESHESLHRDFRLYHSRQYRSNTQHPEYIKYLLHAVLTYNSLHAGAENSRSEPHAQPPDQPPPDSSPEAPDAPPAPPPHPQQPPASHPPPESSSSPPSPPPSSDRAPTSSNQQVCRPVVRLSYSSLFLPPSPSLSLPLPPCRLIPSLSLSLPLVTSRSPSLSLPLLPSPTPTDRSTHLTSYLPTYLGRELEGGREREREGGRG